MDPIHLRIEELDHELALRGVFGLSNQRIKTSKLREFLNKESEGSVVAPKSSSFVASSDIEIKVCHQIYQDIVRTSDVAIRDGNFLELKRSHSRLQHVMARSERIQPLSQDEVVNVAEILDCVYDAIYRVVNVINMNTRNVRRNNTSVLDSRGEIVHPAQLTESSHHSAVTRSLSPSGAQGGEDEPNLDARESLCDVSLIREEEREDILLENIIRSDPLISENRGARNSSTIASQPSFGYTAGKPPTVPTSKANDFRLDVGNIRVNYPALQDQFLLPNMIQMPKRSVPRYSFGKPIQSSDSGQNYRSLFDSNPMEKGVRDGGNCLPIPNNYSNKNSNNFALRSENIFDENQFRNPEPPSLFRAPQANNQRNINRRSVPVNQWRITFGGDGRGLHLYDFLSQVTALQRSEGISNNDMYYSIIHLLTGRARLWYQSMGDQYQSWTELAEAMKREFLPDNYDYQLLADINNRTQKNGETFGEYITHMTAMFRSLGIPVAEEHKLYIVQRNLLPKYAMSVAPLEISSVRQLSDVCRRIDNATAVQRNSTVPFSLNTYNYSRPTQHREVHEIEEDHKVYENQPPEEENFNEDFELCAVHKNQNQNQNKNKKIDAMEQKGTSNTTQVKRKVVCWNCRQDGHIFNECAKPRNGVFCFKCGLEGVVVTTCLSCAENDERNPGKMDGNRSSVNNPFRRKL